MSTVARVPGETGEQRKIFNLNFTGVRFRGLECPGEGSDKADRCGRLSGWPLFTGEFLDFFDALFLIAGEDVAIFVDQDVAGSARIVFRQPRGFGFGTEHGEPGEFG